MKKTILFLIGFVFAIHLFAQKDKPDNFRIEGTINADTGTVRLYFTTGFTHFKDNILVAPVRNNKFVFTGNITDPQSVLLFYEERFRSGNFIIDKGKQNMVVHLDSIDKTPFVDNIIMREENPKYNAFFKTVQVLFDQYYQEGRRLRNKYNYQLPDSIAEKEAKKYKFICDLDNRTLLDYSRKNRNSEMVLCRLSKLTVWGYEPIYDSIFAALSPRLKSRESARILANKLREGRVLKVGKQFPLMNAISPRNEIFSTAIFLNTQYTLVDFWYSGCGPCWAQFDHLRNLYDKYHSKGFEIVGISVDLTANKSKWESVVLKQKLIWKQYWDENGKESSRFSINAYPTNFLIDSTGRIVEKNISMSGLEKFLSEKFQD